MLSKFFYGVIVSQLNEFDASLFGSIPRVAGSRQCVEQNHVVSVHSAYLVTYNFRVSLTD